ncbi:MAG: hypothetical protein FJ116_00160 [Deltaproteobacteria bacterium]|nr:hypothetical protein [Deltaproteobacteria bacterium]MBM4315874.1 hypothetical protein [Deltaproteobacteria bacterium]
MDQRFPKWLRTFVYKLEFLGIPNLAPLICAMAILAFAAKAMGGASIERFLFDPDLVLQGQWWRLFGFPISDGLNNPIYLIFYVLYLYFVVNTLESQWGPGPLTVFLLLGYLSALAASFLTMQPISIWFHILENVSLAFGTLFPDLELYIYFILPVKAKWLALLAGALILFKFIFATLLGKLFISMTLFPYLLFFSPLLFNSLKTHYRVRKNRKKFDSDSWR